MAIEQVNSSAWRSLKSNNNAQFDMEIGDRGGTFYPQLKLSRWSGESDLTFRFPLTEAVPSLQNDKLTFSHASGISGEFFETERGFKFNIILASRPPSNAVTFLIQGVNNVRFLQQPVQYSSLEIARGNFRPEWIKGSYALYHPFLANNAYQTGKIAHLDRPLLIDNLGNQIYADMIIDEQAGTMTYVVDGSWLDSAAYPVTVDPTFGYTSAGGTQDNTNDYTIGTKHNFSGTTGSTIDDYNAYVSQDIEASNNLGIAVYDHDSGGNKPNNLLEESNGTRTITTSGAWYQNTVGGAQSLTNGTDYWLHVVSDIGTGFNSFYDVDAGFRTSYKGSGVTTFPDPYGVETGNLGWKMSIYLNYSAPGGATGKSNPMIGPLGGPMAGPIHA